MLFLAILLSAVLFYVMQMKLYEKMMIKQLQYTVRLEAEEVFAGEDIYLYEELSNDKALPLPFVKVNADLPEGLYFHFIDRIDGEVKDIYEGNTQSIYVVESYRKINRRWRVTCKTRGIYRIGKHHLVTNDLFGMNTSAVAVDALPGFQERRLVVLPETLDLRTEFLTADGYCGDVIVRRSMITDPMQRAGTRVYQTSDPMRAINWMSTAAHGHLMVNIEEQCKPFLFHIVMNMQSRDIEKHPDVPSAPFDIEQCIRVTGTLLSRAAEEDIPVQMFFNAPPKMLLTAAQEADENVQVLTAGDDAVGEKIATAPTCRGKRDLLDALRLLAALPMQISVPEEQLLDHILAYPESYTRTADGTGHANLIMVSAYFSERMIAFHRAMAQRHINVIYYITSTSRNALRLPDDIEIYFSVGSILEPNA